MSKKKAEVLAAKTIQIVLPVVNTMTPTEIRKQLRKDIKDPSSRLYRYLAEKFGYQAVKVGYPSVSDNHWFTRHESVKSLLGPSKKEESDAAESE